MFKFFRFIAYSFFFLLSVLVFLVIVGEILKYGIWVGIEDFFGIILILSFCIGFIYVLIEPVLGIFIKTKVYKPTFHQWTTESDEQKAARIRNEHNIAEINRRRDEDEYARLRREKETAECAKQEEIKNRIKFGRF